MRLRWPLLFLLIGACAQPITSDRNPHNAKDGGSSDLARSDLRSADLANGSPDLVLPSLGDLANPGDPDLATNDDPDLATNNSPDLKTPPTDLGTLPDLVSPNLPDMVNACAGAGGACSTGQAGVCAAGTLTCVSGALQCVRNVAPAARENCFNTLDDDCSGAIDNGCPTAVGVGTPAPLGWVGGSGGGSGSVRCPAGQFVGAVRYFYDEYDYYMAGMGLFCTTPSLVKGGSSYSVTTSSILSVTPINFYGSDVDYSDDGNNCVSGGALGTVSQHALTGDLGGSYSGYYVDGIESRCGSGTANWNNSTNQLTFSFSPYGSYTGWSYVDDTAWVYSCPAGSVLVGYDYRIGAWLDAIRVVCAPLTVTYKP